MGNGIAGAMGTPTEAIRQKCPDCLYCQLCSKSRCRCCREKREDKGFSGLRAGFTYGEYQAWAANRQE